MLTIDGSAGEGGGQILRTSLALSLLTSTPFRIEKIRAGRKRPGLLRQHLTAVKAAAAVGKADVSGNEPGSQELTFRPGGIAPGSYHFAVGTAGSTTLVLQTVLPALLAAQGASTIALEGGTHNPAAPPYDFIEKTFLPVLCRMGPRVTAALDRPGFFPAGGGRMRVSVSPAPSLGRLDLLERGEIRRIRARAIVSRLPRHIGEREVRGLARVFCLGAGACEVEEVPSPQGPGNAVLLEVESEQLTEVFTGFGERGVPAERVAEGVVREAREYLEAGAPVGRHLADQLLLPLALAGGGSFRTVEPSLHTTTSVDVLRSFLSIDVAVAQVSERVWQVEVKSAP